MQIQVSTDNNINGSANLIENVEAELKESLVRFGSQITRIEVHLRDVNGAKTAGDNKSCLLEARLAGRQPLVVSHEAPSLRQAIDGATDKLERALDHLLGKLNDRKGRPSFAGEETS
ncbi:MAG: HPF/RaiA family ribosome-associated protein [Pirellulales bacterium]